MMRQNTQVRRAGKRGTSEREREREREREAAYLDNARSLHQAASLARLRVNFALRLLLTKDLEQKTRGTDEKGREPEKATEPERTRHSEKSGKDRVRATKKTQRWRKAKTDAERQHWIETKTEMERGRERASATS